MLVRFAALLLLCSLTSGCCQLLSKKERQPDRPGITSSWSERTDFGVTSIGFFVMNKGEAIDNGLLGVKVIDVLPQECRCLSCEPTGARARVAFYRPDDSKVLCEGEFHRGAADVAVVSKCPPDMGVSVIAINAINTKDEWVSFDLRK